ncbi:MAG: PrsW family intramembrane metalloprotease [Firmicutes bacterium]|nr:PrsW family intramembrane metalloprotease [Bacillota bacterium]
MSVATIYIGAAVLPALVLMFYVYKKDKIEKESPRLLIRLILMGVLAALLSGVLETGGMALLNGTVSTYSPLYIPILAIMIGLIEEGTKYALMKKVTWRNLEFNFVFDGIVYAAFISLGFAAFENIGYVLGYGLGVAPTRALLAIPGHLSFSVFMGAFYGRAKLYSNYGDEGRSRAARRMGFLIAVAMHAFYDACAMTDSTLSSLLFLAFVVIVDILVILTLRRESRNDRPLW